ncbi:uncharacterized protein V6R79_025214 [Siganus canaliculatus]
MKLQAERQKGTQPSPGGESARRWAASPQRHPPPPPPAAASRRRLAAAFAVVAALCLDPGVRGKMAASLWKKLTFTAPEVTAVTSETFSVSIGTSDV